METNVMGVFLYRSNASKWWIMLLYTVMVAGFTFFRLELT